MGRNHFERYSILIAFSLVVLFTSCSRFETERGQVINERPDTRSEALTDNYVKNWKVIAITLNDSLSEPIDTCRQDDEYYFHFDGFFQLDLGDQLCDNESEPNINGNWELQQEQTILQITYESGFIGVFNVLELDRTDLIIEGSAYDQLGNYIGMRKLHLRALS